MKKGYLYIARDPLRPTYLKIGQTMRLPKDRVKQLQGYGQRPFELVATFATADCLKAEQLVFSMLEHARHPQYPELLKVDIETAKEICRKAILQIPPVRQIAISATDSLSIVLVSKNALWPKLLEYQVSFQGKKISIGNLLVKAHTESTALSRLIKLGIQRVVWQTDRVTYSISSLTSGPLIQWLAANNCLPADLKTSDKNPLHVRFKVIPV